MYYTKQRWLSLQDQVVYQGELHILLNLQLNCEYQQAQL